MSIERIVRELQRAVVDIHSAVSTLTLEAEPFSKQDEVWRKLQAAKDALIEIKVIMDK